MPEPQPPLPGSVLTGGASVRPRPGRPGVNLISKADPLRRLQADATALRRDGARPEQRQARGRDEERDAVYACGGYTDHLNALLRSLPKPSLRGALLVRERMRAEGIPMDQTTFNLLLDKVADLRDPTAFEVFRDFQDEAGRDDGAVRPDLTTVRLMVRACERCGDYRRAFQIYSQCKELYGVFPDVPLYNTLIGFCAPLRDETTASYIVEEMRDRNAEPDVHTYNILMNVFADAPVELILLTFEDMAKRRLKPNRRTFNTLMRACQRSGDYDKVFQFFEEMKREGLAPDVVTYNTLLVACRDRLDFVLGTGGHAAAGRTKEQREDGTRIVAQLAMTLLAEMEEGGVDPNTFTYNALFAVLSRCRDRRVFECFEHMKDAEARAAMTEPADTPLALPAHAGEGPLPSIAECEALLEHAIASQPARDGAGDAEGAMADRISTVGVRATLGTYAALIDAAVRIGVPAEAFALFDEMATRGIAPDRGVFLRLLDACSLNGDKRRAAELLDVAARCGVAPDTTLYNALLNVLAEAGDAEAWEVLDVIREDRKRLSLRPDRDTYNLMLKAALNMRDLPAALRLYEGMCAPSAPVAPDATSFGLLLDNCAAHKDVPQAAELMLDMRRRGVQPTIDTYSRHMNVFVQAGDAGVIEVFNGLKRHGPEPDLRAYTTVMEFFLRTRNDAVVGTFEEMKRAGIEPDLRAYNVMLQFAAAVESQQRAFKYLEELKVRGLVADVETYNALIAVFAPKGTDFVSRVFEEMADNHVAPNEHTLAILMRHKQGRRALKEAADQQIIKFDTDTLGAIL